MDIAELDSLLDNAKPPFAEIPICLRGDLQAAWEKLDAQLIDLRNAAAATLAGTPSTEQVELAGQIKALEEQMANSTVIVRLEALSRRPWRDLIEAHQPREGNAGDASLGFNQETYFDALVGACIVSPEFDEERLEKFLNKITPNQFDTLSGAAWGLNRRDVSVPFSRTASLINMSSGGTSKQLSDSASATASSPAGSRRKSPSTSTKVTA